MIELNEKKHISIVICSLIKLYKNAEIFGKLKPIDIYYFNIIYKLLNSNLELTNDENNFLIQFYNKLIYESDKICQPFIYKTYQTTVIKTFTQMDTTDCNTYPERKEILYWQEPYTISNLEIKNLVDDTNYLVDKFSDTYSQFESGKTITYINVGKIVFLALESNSTNYSIKDIIGNDVTHTFEITNLPLLNATLFISNNIYSHGEITFKIIQQ